ncbi:DUF2637 domain-containing protein [Kitasatospora sp. NPDC001175]|uniref:DUF2637 domain-containing protein n=1 Tax=Kitasatospora sp. NPDC001175 TaxID=3157103 RepID=UPI003CFCB97A
MPTSPAAPPATSMADPGAFTRTTITTVMAVIAALAFVFSFGNVWALALRLGIPRPIAPLIAPMVDLSVVGLLVALHHLASTGADPAQLRSATRLMHLCGLLTLALNTAEPLLAGHYGRAALDTVAPALLLGWGAVGPTLLRHLHAPTAMGSGTTDRSPSSETDIQAAEAGAEPQMEPVGDEGQAPLAEPAGCPGAEREPAAPRKRTGRRPAATMEQLLEIARPAVAEYGLTTAVVRKALVDAKVPISAKRFTQLTDLLRVEQAGPQSAQADEQPAAA